MWLNERNRELTKNDIFFYNVFSKDFINWQPSFQDKTRFQKSDDTLQEKSRVNAQWIQLHFGREHRLANQPRQKETVSRL